MGSVHPIKVDSGLAEFFDFVLGEQEGFAYSPTKHPLTHEFEQYFFKWPSEKAELISHVQRLSPTHEVYYAPALYSKPAADKESFLGTWFVWAEFDGALPDDIKDLPQPSLKIRSSTDSHEHWYWKIEYFINDPEIVENISQRLTYHLGADHSAWNANRVLRPPGTVHHESSRQTELLRFDSRPIKLEEFAKLPDVAVKILSETDIGFVPDPADVIAKYAFPKEDWEFFKTREIAKGSGEGGGGRSAALTKLAHICMELGMNNAETLSLLLHKDTHWKKYLHRRDQRNRLLGIINHCRAKHPIDPVEEEIESPLKVFTYEEFMNTKIQIDWVIKDFIHKKGLVVLFGKGGVGKSTATLRFAQALSTGGKFLKWQVERPMRSLFISLEMHAEELKFSLDGMKFPEKEIDLLRQNMLLIPLGASIKIASKIAQEHLNRVVEEFQPECIMIDSLGVAIGENLNGDDTAFKVLDYINLKLRREYGAFVWLIHHPRKSQIGNKKPNQVDDMHGSAYFGNEATNIFTMWPSGPAIDVDCLKLRLAKNFDKFKVRRTSDHNFELIEGVSINYDKPIFEQEEIDPASAMGSI